MASQSLPEPLTPQSFENLILRRLSPDDLALLTPSLERISVASSRVLQDVGDPIEYAYFPESGMLCILAITEAGQSLEVAAVGREGVIGPRSFGGGSTSFLRLIGQVADSAVRVSAPVFQEALLRSPVLAVEYANYANLLFIVAAQSTICTQLHQVGERLVRWLLTVRDATQTEDFVLTQEFMAEMLGVNRPTVTIAARMLAQAGLIEYRRGRVRIVDTEGLEESACECYKVLRTQYGRMPS